MGANVVNTVAEGVAPIVRDISGGRVGLRILSNLASHRTATATFNQIVVVRNVPVLQSRIKQLQKKNARLENQLVVVKEEKRKLKREKCHFADSGPTADRGTGSQHREVMH